MKTKTFNYGAYPRDNDIVVNYLELTPLVGDNVFTSLYEKDERGETAFDTLYIILRVKDIYFVQDTYRRSDTENDRFQQSIASHCENWIDITLKNAAQDRFIRKMEIRVFEELGLDAAPLIRSRETFLKNREEEERRKKEEYERQRKEAAEQREREENERLDKVKADFLADRYIDPDDFLAIAKRDGYDIHIRTIGTIRKRITSMRKDGSYSYRHIKGKPRPNTEGFGKALFGYLEFLEDHKTQPQS